MVLSATVFSFNRCRQTLLTTLLVLPVILLTSCSPVVYPVDRHIDVEGKSLDELLDLHTDTRRDLGNDIIAFVDGDQTYQKILDLIDSAQDHINIQTLNFDTDEDQPEQLGLDIAYLLVEKAQQGVEVNIILDGIFQQYISKPTAVDILKEGGVTVKYFMPPLSRILMGQLLYRTHKKMFIADGVRAVVGGSNLGYRYLGPDQWRDTNVALTGPAVASLQEQFLRDWEALGTIIEIEDESRYFPPLEPTGEIAVRVIDQRPSENEFDINQAVLIAIRVARETIDIQTPYFNLTPWLAEELTDAARRGVRVRVLTNSEASSNMAPLYWTAANTFEGLIGRGIEIYLWDRGPRTLHSKVMVVDDQMAMISSFNFSHRSAIWDAENGIILTDPQAVGMVREMVEHDLHEDFIFQVDRDWINSHGRRIRSLWRFTYIFNWLF